MSSVNLRATAVGFAVTIVILTVMVLLVGPSKLLTQLAKADLSIVGLVIASSVIWLASWALVLRFVMRSLGVNISVIKAFLMYASAAFSNNVTPLGQAGGEPLTALIFSRATDIEYEESLAAIASVDALNFIPSSVFIVVGAAYYATEVTLGRNIYLAVGFVIVVAIIVPIVLRSIWVRRDAAEQWIATVITTLLSKIARFIPKFTAPNESDIHSRTQTFFDSVELIGSDPKHLAFSLGFSAAGWVMQAASLWLALRAVGVSIPFSAALFIVPMGAIAGATPLPGGTGSIEPVLIGLLATITGVAIPSATAAVIIFRGTVFWLPIIIGGLFAGFLTVEP